MSFIELVVYVVFGLVAFLVLCLVIGFVLLCYPKTRSLASFVLWVPTVGSFVAIFGTYNCFYIVELRDWWHYSIAWSLMSLSIGFLAGAAIGTALGLFLWQRSRQLAQKSA